MNLFYLACFVCLLGSCAASSCQKDTGVTPKSYTDVKKYDDAALMSALAQQPVSIAIEADQSSFQLYKSGECVCVYKSKETKTVFISTPINSPEILFKHCLKLIRLNLSPRCSYCRVRCEAGSWSVGCRIRHMDGWYRLLQS